MSCANAAIDGIGMALNTKMAVELREASVYVSLARSQIGSARKEQGSKRKII
jgi:hypothetical protein